MKWPRTLLIAVAAAAAATAAGVAVGIAIHFRVLAESDSSRGGCMTQ
jgi:hypothetical protein